MGWCYDPGSSLRKRNDLQEKDGLTSVLRYLTNGSVQTNAKDSVSGARMGGSKGQPLMAAMEVGAEDTGGDGYRRSNEEGSGEEGVWIQLG